jgi:Protein of unknown function (DUF3303)
MKVLSTSSVRPGCVKEVVSRFLAGKGTPPTGVKVLGRWHQTDGSASFALYETDDPAALAEFVATWADVLEVHHSVVLEDAEFAAVLAKVFGK